MLVIAVTVRVTVAVISVAVTVSVALAMRVLMRVRVWFAAARVRVPQAGRDKRTDPQRRGDRDDPYAPGCDPANHC